MSEHTKEEISCPECDSDFTVELWDMINGTVNPELRDKLLSEELFVNECPYCHTPTYVPWDTVYQDMEHRFMLFLRHDVDEEPLPVELNNYYGIVGIAKGYVMRTVYGIPSLKEKMFVLEHDLDDRVVEYLKYLIKNDIYTVKHDLWDWSYELRFFAVEEDGKLLTFFCVDSGGDMKSELNIPIDVYQAALLKVQQDPRMKVEQGEVVNYKWIDKRMRQL